MFCRESDITVGLAWRLCLVALCFLGLSLSVPSNCASNVDVTDQVCVPLTANLSQSYLHYGDGD